MRLWLPSAAGLSKHFSPTDARQSINLPLTGDDAAIKKYAAEVEALKKKIGMPDVEEVRCWLHVRARGPWTGATKAASLHSTARHGMGFAHALRPLSVQQPHWRPPSSIQPPC